MSAGHRRAELDPIAPASQTCDEVFFVYVWVGGGGGKEEEGRECDKGKDIESTSKHKKPP